MRWFLVDAGALKTSAEMPPLQLGFLLMLSEYCRVGKGVLEAVVGVTLKGEDSAEIPPDTTLVVVCNPQPLVLCLLLNPWAKMDWFLSWTERKDRSAINFPPVIVELSAHCSFCLNMQKALTYKIALAGSVCIPLLSLLPFFGAEGSQSSLCYFPKVSALCSLFLVRFGITFVMSLSDDKTWTCNITIKLMRCQLGSSCIRRLSYSLQCVWLSVLRKENK